MSDIVGSGVRDGNTQFRILSISAMGVLAIGAVLYWRSQLMLASDYQGVQVSHEQTKILNQNRARQQALQKSITDQQSTSTN